MSQIVPSAGFTPPCDYSNFADTFDLSLLPGGDLTTTTSSYTDQTPKVYTTFYSDSTITEEKADVDLGPDFQKLLAPQKNPPSPAGIYLEVPTAKNYHANSPIGALAPYSPQLLSPNEFSVYPPSEYYPSSPELSLYNSPHSSYTSEDYNPNTYVKKEVFTENEKSGVSIDDQNVFELLGSSLLDKQIKQESTVDFGSLLQPYSPQLEEEKCKPQDHQLLREVLKDTSFQKKYNIKTFDFGFEVKMEEPDENLQKGICSEQLAREKIEPVLDLAIEQMRKDVDKTCATLGISPDPSQWTQANVLSWLEWTSREFQIPAPVPEQWEITGSGLVCLSEEDFVRRSPQGGAMLYAQLEIWKAAFLEEDLNMHWLPETTSNASSGDISDEEDEEMHPPTSEAKPTTSRPSGGSHIHLWQFLKELLSTPQVHGSCIRWLDRTKGVFKIEDSVKVARLWGKRKNRPAMNYDKLSRSIRQYYKKGIMKKTERSQRLKPVVTHKHKAHASALAKSINVSYAVNIRNIRTMSVKLSRPRKTKPKDDMKSEIVAQVHKTSKREISSDRETLRTEGSEESSGSNKTYVREDIKNDNCSIHNTPSRDISVDGDSQINSKIISLIEAEIKREVRHATFSDSRPQSLSFYEEEKMPEELSGNLELLSPEERKHYKRRKDYGQMDTDERNMYNSIQDIYNRENDDMITSGSLKKSKSRKKKHGDSEMGMGDSREMMIPKEKRKSKKKKHECSPMSGKRKHRKREEEFEPRNDITMALDDLQDDVFENGVDEFPGRHDKIRKSPRKGDKLYVQKKNKFELSARDSSQMENHPLRQQFNRPIFTPLQSAINVQKYWRKFTTFCHGLLGGLGFAHFIYISTNQFSTNPETLRNYAAYSDTYVILFYVLCILCLISVFDKYDIAHIDVESLKDLLKSRKSCFVIIVYVATLVLHLATTPTDDKIALVAQDFSYAYNITIEDLKIWNSLSFSRAFLAFMAWFFVSLTSSEDYLYLNLKSMEGGSTIPEIQSP